MSSRREKNRDINAGREFTRVYGQRQPRATHSQLQTPSEGVMFLEISLGLGNAPIVGVEPFLEISFGLWSGRVDSNHRPPGPEPGALARLSHAPRDGECRRTHEYSTRLAIQP